MFNQIWPLYKTAKILYKIVTSVRHPWRGRHCFGKMVPVPAILVCIHHQQSPEWAASILMTDDLLSRGFGVDNCRYREKPWLYLSEIFLLSAKLYWRWLMSGQYEYGSSMRNSDASGWFDSAYRIGENSLCPANKFSCAPTDCLRILNNIFYGQSSPYEWNRLHFHIEVEQKATVFSS